MTGRTHDLAALTALGAVVFLEPSRTITLSIALVALLANQIGGIIPDIDQPTAPFWRNLPIGGSIGRIFDKMLGGHRFISHSLLGMALFGGIAYGLLVFLHPSMPHIEVHLVWWAFMIGMLSHLILDTFTKEGVPWLLPLPTKIGLPPIKKFRVTTGKSVETFVVFPLLLIIDIWFCISHYDFLLSFIHTRIT
jgi:inner membrane protein